MTAAAVVCEDGRVFRGRCWGARGRATGELVFTTGTTGYQETLTDPSFAGQLVVATAPHIGNTGMNDEDPESGRLQVAGYVVRDPARSPSSWRSRGDLGEALAGQGVVGVAGVDTRALTRHLCARGAMRGLLTSDAADLAVLDDDPGALLSQLRALPSMAGAELASTVSTAHPYVVPAGGARRAVVAALDLGIKASSPAELARRGIEVHVLPAAATLADVLAVADGGPDGLFVSNGPGDPATADGPVEVVRAALARSLPVFGICFGNQVLGRALGLGTYKLRYGHRGLNIPVLDRGTGRVAITAQNHGFAVAPPGQDTAPATRGTAARAPSGEPFDTAAGRVRVSHVCLNDGSVEGLTCLDVPAFSVQYHPEAAAGPHDANPLFDRFAALVGAGPSADPVGPGGRV